MNRFAYALVACLVVSACNRGPDKSANTAPPGKIDVTVVGPKAPVAPPATPDSGPDPFVGKYQLAGDEGPNKGLVTITKSGEGYTVDVDVGAPGCGGRAKGPATASGDVLHLIAHTDEADLKCEVTLTRKGQALAVEEGEGCRDFHGAQCDLDGTAKRK